MSKRSLVCLFFLKEEEIKILLYGTGTDIQKKKLTKIREKKMKQTPSNLDLFVFALLWNINIYIYAYCK